CASVATVRTFSMSAGLAASTVTPGNTAPIASFTTPPIAPEPPVWAAATAGVMITELHITANAILDTITTLLGQAPGRLDHSRSRHGPSRPHAGADFVCELQMKS